MDYQKEYFTIAVTRDGKVTGKRVYMTAPEREWLARGLKALVEASYITGWSIRREARDDFNVDEWLEFLSHGTMRFEKGFVRR